MLTENEKAYLWRKAMGFSRAKLARLTGFSASNIADIETGIYRENGKPIADTTMQRYRLACGALTADVRFNWYRAKVKVNGTSVDIPVARE
jgi:transcriptional regulator with XRE-family HTH domain